MTKATFFISMVAAITGLLLIVPASPVIWPAYSLILVAHVIISLGLIGFVFWVSVTHVRRVMKNGALKKPKGQTGAWYMIVLLLTFGTGFFIMIRSGFAISWMTPLHLVAGAWSMILGWKHSVRRKSVQVPRLEQEWKSSRVNIN